MEHLICHGCGFSTEVNDDSEARRIICPQCGTLMEKALKEIQTEIAEMNNTGELAQKIPVPAPDLAETPDPEPREYRISFTGTAGEYFRIWIVNTFLTILTCGIYAAWAKVRTRQYFYANTTIADHPFEYLADPAAILKGNLIIGAGAILYSFSEAYSPTVSGVVIIAFYLIVPFLIYKSLRFNAHNSAFRNIRFRFLGTPGDSYLAYLIIPLFLIPLTLGIIIPYWGFLRKKYFFDNLAFGTTESRFDGRAKPFYKAYAAGFLGLILLGCIAAAVLFPIFRAISSENSPFDNSVFIMIPIITYLFILVAFAFIQQYLYARLNNYCWEHTALGNLRFKCELRFRELLWIRVTNILAIIFSLGMLIPWAKIRRTRYVLENLTVITNRDLDEFAASVESGQSAVGDSATDFFDIEIGL